MKAELLTFLSVALILAAPGQANAGAPDAFVRWMIEEFGVLSREGAVASESYAGVGEFTGAKGLSGLSKLNADPALFGGVRGSLGTDAGFGAFTGGSDFATLTHGLSGRTLWLDEPPGTPSAILESLAGTGGPSQSSIAALRLRRIESLPDYVRPAIQPPPVATAPANSPSAAAATRAQDSSARWWKFDLTGKLAIGPLKTFETGEIGGGEINVYKWAGIGGAAGLHCWNHNCGNEVYDFLLNDQLDLEKVRGIADEMRKNDSSARGAATSTAKPLKLEASQPPGR